MRFSANKLFFLTVLIIIAISVAVAEVLSRFVRYSINTLAADNLSLGTTEFSRSLSSITLFQYVAIVLLGLFIIFTVFLLLNKFIFAPLKALSATIKDFSKNMNISVPILAGPMLIEMSSIFNAVAEMIKKVETAHLKDLEISKTKSDFISTAAHQLRTPLTGIRWTLEALEKDENLSTAKKQMVTDALGKNKQLVAIVKTLLDVSAIESGKYKYTFENIDIVKLANQSIEEFSKFALDRNVHVSMNLEEEVPVVRADAERIRWVLNNIIENAIKYTPDKGSVKISFRNMSNRVFIYISDTGIGIPEQDRVNIFNRFYRGKNASIKENEGNGLGLYIARNVVRDHGGDLEFKANGSGIGTTFFFSLPMANPQFIGTKDHSAIL